MSRLDMSLFNPQHNLKAPQMKIYHFFVTFTDGSTDTYNVASTSLRLAKAALKRHHCENLLAFEFLGDEIS